MNKVLQIFIAVIPLVVSLSSQDPTLHIRFLFLSVIVSGLLLFYLFQKQKIESSSLLNPFMICFSVLIATYLLSAFYNGFGSESIYIILKLFLIYCFSLIIIQHVKKHGYKILLNSFVYFSLFASIIYFFQLITSYSEIISLEATWKREEAFNAIAGSMGHKNLFSSIQFLLLPILIHVFISSNKKMRILSLIAILLFITALLQTQTRAVLFALIIFLVSLLLLVKQKITKKHIIYLFSSFVLVLSAGYMFTKYTNRYDAFVKEIDKTLEFTSSARYKLYKSSLKLIGENPLFGVGPGNWRIKIWEYDLYKGTLGKMFAQRPHNDFLWVFSEGGMVAGISYMLLFLILIKDAYYLHKRRKNKDNLFYALLFSCFLGYGFISLVDFPLERISHNIIFFVLASFIIASKKQETKYTTSVFILPLLIIISIYSVYVAYIRYDAEKHTKTAIYYKNKGNWNRVIKEIDKAYNKDYYEIENTSTPLLWYRGVAYFNQNKYNKALIDFKDAYVANPYHVHVLNNLATSYEINKERIKAKEYYNKALKINPTFKETRINLAAILFNEKDYVNALEVILKSNVAYYKKRVKNNDNYDLYLKTIVKGWVNSIQTENDKEKKELDKVIKEFDNNPEKAAWKWKKINQKREENKVDYLTALMLFENKK